MESGNQVVTIPEGDDGSIKKHLAVETEIMEDNCTLEKTVDSCLSVFQQSLSPRKSSRYPDEQRARYRKRLESFQASTYFAKPCRLSPIVVARFGWKNLDRDVLQCESCQAVVAVVFHHKLSKTATDKMVSWYETQLSESHSVSCPFRRVAIQYYNDMAKEKPSSLSPFPSSVLASVLPVKELDLLEHGRPTTTVRELVQKILCSVSGENAFKYEPYQNVPANILNYPMQEGEAVPSLLTRMVDILFPSSELEAVLPTTDSSGLETAVVLVLFGWRQREGESKSDHPLDLMCSLCLASLSSASPSGTIDTQQTANNAGVESPPASKRSRTGRCPRAPWSAHRYYCPYMCGFASPELSKPLWQTLVDKFLPNSTSNKLGSPRQAQDSGSAQIKEEQPSAWMQIHRMLTQGISTCRPSSAKRSRGMN